MNHEIHEKHEKNKIVIYQEESYAIQGVVFEVYREMGCGFLEAVYQECLELEFKSKGIPFTPKKELQLLYKNQFLNKKYVPDFVCYDKIIVEIKTVKEILPEHQAQIFNYLKATNFKLGILVNFGAFPKAKILRIVN